jgi:hypothetical protein
MASFKGNIARNKAVTGCFAMFALFFSITCLPLFFEGSKDQRSFFIPSAPKGVDDSHSTDKL